MADLRGARIRGPCPPQALRFDGADVACEPYTPRGWRGCGVAQPPQQGVGTLACIVYIARVKTTHSTARYVDVDIDYGLECL